MIEVTVGDLLVLDVRSQQEWQRNHLSRAVWTEWHDVGVIIGTLVSSLEHPIMMYCCTGYRSGKAQEILEYMGYSKVVNGGSLAQAMQLIEDRCAT